MELRRKLEILADAAKYDASCASSASVRKAGKSAKAIGSTEGGGICHSYTPDGRCVSLLKILLTNYCVYDCRYCINRVSSDVPRARFRPEEVVELTLSFYRRNCIEGLFLSSGVLKNPDYTLEQMVRVAKLLREEHHFGGYIHLKIVPGASPELVEEAGRYADRLSCNAELPRERDLAELAPEKSEAQVQAAMQTMHSIESHAAAPASGKATSARGRSRAMPAGQSTQMLVGVNDAPDAAILYKASELYRRYALRRVYYTAYSVIPFAHARLSKMPVPLLREHRLYQADWLHRFYGFAVDEIVPAEHAMLSMEHDPKTAWALRHRERFPVDVNVAPRDELLRVPGLGVRNVERILRVRRYHRIGWDDLRRMRVPLARAAAFLQTREGASPALRRLDSLKLEPALRRAPQLELFATLETARSGEL